MTVYFMGTESEDFPTRTGSVLQNTNAAYRKSANTRVAVQITRSSSGEDINFMETDAFSSSDFWSHVVWAINNPPGAGASQYITRWYSGGVKKLGFRWSNMSAGTLEIAKWTGAAWSLLATVGDAMFAGAGSIPYTLDFYIKLGNPGEMRVYFNGFPAIVRNDLDLSGISAIDRLRLDGGANLINGEGMYSEIIVADFCTVGSKIVSRPPTGNGSYQEWTNGGFAIVDDVDATGADLATSATANQRTTYTHAALTALGGTEVLAGVKVAAAVNREVTGPQNLNFMTRISTTDYNGADQSLSTTSGRNSQMWENSPASATAWTIAEINAAHMGVRSRT
jgi:hypothetical protein